MHKGAVWISYALLSISCRGCESVIHHGYKRFTIAAVDAKNGVVIPATPVQCNHKCACCRSILIRATLSSSMVKEQPAERPELSMKCMYVSEVTLESLFLRCSIAGTAVMELLWKRWSCHGKQVASVDLFYSTGLQCALTRICFRLWSA